MESRKLKDTLFEYAIDIYMMSIYTTMVAENQVIISKQIPQQVGLIYGLSIYTDGVTPTNDALITSVNAESLFLTFKDGPTEFFQPLRLDQLIFKSSGFPNIDAEQYYPININGNFDLSTSFYANPLAIAAGKVMLNLHYISTESFLYLMNNKIVKQDPEAFMKGKRK